MKNEKGNGYRKNFSLIVTFIVLISALFILSLFLAYNFSKKYVENEFATEKVKVLERTVKPYNDLFQNKLSEISYYNGYLDSLAAAKFIDTIFRKYSFVNAVTFYDAEVKNTPVDADGIARGGFNFGPKATYNYVRGKKEKSTKISFKADDFNELALKLQAYIENLDTTRIPTQDELFSEFSNVRANKITYLNIPQSADLKAYKTMLNSPEGPPKGPKVVFQQDMLTFKLDPYKILIDNTNPLLYQKIEIKPVTYDPIVASNDVLRTEITLPGPFSDYKLYFTSARSFLITSILQSFLPISLVLLMVYCVLMLVAFLIFRNLNINQKMYKLQYDFVNNLTHEFKTPVSVIKIAGNNIRSSKKLSIGEQQLYGKILDEEADKLNGLMNKLLSFTQIENRFIELNMEEIYVADFIESTIDAHKLKHPDFQFTSEVVGFETFFSDPVLLGSLFDNLAENAYKYSSPGNKVLHIRATFVKGKIVFRFTDQGIGIPSSEINNIFKKFYRVQNQYNQNGSVGLGLAFCKELVNFMNGEITVKSRIGKGTEFKIVLPAI